MIWEHLKLFELEIRKEVDSYFRKINERLHKHLENLDAIEKSKLPVRLVNKCKEFSKLILETTAKADNVIEKLDCLKM